MKKRLCLTLGLVLLGFFFLKSQNPNEIFIKNPRDKEIYFDPNSTPVWSYSFLRKTTIDFLNNARGLEEKMIGHIRSKQDKEWKGLLLGQGIEMGELNVKMANNAVGMAEREKEKADLDVTLAETRISNKEEQISDTESTLDFNRKKQEEIRGRSFWNTVGKVGITVVAAAATYLSAGTATPITATLVAKAWASPDGVAATNQVVDGFVNKANSKDADAMQNRSTEDLIKDRKRDLLDLGGIYKETKKSAIIADSSLSRARIGLEVAELELEHRKVQFDLYINQQKELPDSILIAETKKIMQTYIRYAILLAKMTERAYELSEVDDITFIKTFDEYYGSEAGSWLVGEKILLDVNSIEYRRVTQKKQKRNNCTYVLSLNSRYPFELQTLRERGIMTFDITQYNLDLAFPGTYAQMISSIDVQVIALTDQSGVKGQLYKEGLSWVKVPDYIASDASADDWLEYVPSDYKLQLLKDPEETLIIPIQRNRIPSADEEGLKGIFEGRGVCGVYSLELPKYSNSFDYNTIVDVVITVNFAAYFDHTLKGMIETEICERENAGNVSNQRELFYSSINSSPDDWYAFNNANPDSAYLKKHRILPLRVYRSDFPSNQKMPTAQSVRVTAINDQGRYDTLNFSLTNSWLNPQVDFLGKDGTLLEHIDYDSLTWKKDSFFYAVNEKENDTVYIKTDTMSFRNRLLIDTTQNVFKNKNYQVWLLKIDIDKNPQYAKRDDKNQIIMEFDEARLKTLVDINWGFGYSFKTDFCDVKPRMMAEMVKEEIGKGEIANGRIIGLQDSTQVPYFYTNLGSQKIKIWQKENVWHEWKTNKKDSTFEQKTIIRNDKYADLIPFYSLFKKRSSQELIEIAFDIDKNISSTATYYLNPTFITLKVEAKGDYRKLTFTVDTAYIEKLTDRDSFSKPVEMTVHKDSICLVFRYIDLSTSKSKSILDIRIRKDGKAQKVLYKPVTFTRWRGRDQTNFSIKIDRDDKPMPNFILKDLKAFDLARF